MVSKDQKKSEELARQAMAIDPELPEAHIAMERVLGVRYKYAEAAKEVHLAIEAEPDNALAWDMYSWVLGYEIPPQAAGSEKAAREAIRLNPALSYAKYHLGRALFLQGRFPEAMEAFDRCEELGGNGSAANFGRAQALRRKSRWKRWKNHLRQVFGIL